MVVFVPDFQYHNYNRYNNCFLYRFFLYFLAFKAEDEKGEQLKRVCTVASNMSYCHFADYIEQCLM